MGGAVAGVETPPVSKAVVILAAGVDVAGGLSVVVGGVEDGRVAGEVAPVEPAEGGVGPLLTTRSVDAAPLAPVVCAPGVCTPSACAPRAPGVCGPGVAGTALEGNEGTAVEAVVCPGRTLGPGNTDEAVAGDAAVALTGAAVAAGGSGCAGAAVATGAVGAAGAEVAAGTTRLVAGTPGVPGTTVVAGTAGTAVGRDATSVVSEIESPVIVKIAIRDISISPSFQIERRSLAFQAHSKTRSKEVKKQTLGWQLFVVWLNANCNCFLLDPISFDLAETSLYTISEPSAIEASCMFC